MAGHNAVVIGRHRDRRRCRDAEAVVSWRWLEVDKSWPSCVVGSADGQTNGRLMYGIGLESLTFYNLLDFGLIWVVFTGDSGVYGAGLER